MMSYDYKSRAMGLSIWAHVHFRNHHDDSDCAIVVSDQLYSQ